MNLAIAGGIWTACHQIAYFDIIKHLSCKDFNILIPGEAVYTTDEDLLSDYKTKYVKREIIHYYITRDEGDKPFSEFMGRFSLNFFNKTFKLYYFNKIKDLTKKFPEYTALIVHANTKFDPKLTAKHGIEALIKNKKSVELVGEEKPDERYLNNDNPKIFSVGGELDKEQVETIIGYLYPAL